MWVWLGQVRVEMWVSIAGTIIAALIGVIGLATVLAVERRDRYRARLDETLADVIGSLARRAEDLEAWADAPETSSSIGRVWMRSNRRSAPGGPMDTDLQAAVEVAWLAARRPEDRQGVAALGDATFNLKRAIQPWQVDRVGRIGADIRRWRSGEIDASEFRCRMGAFSDEAIASGAAYDRERAERAAEREAQDAQRRANLEAQAVDAATAMLAQGTAARAAAGES